MGHISAYIACKLDNSASCNSNRVHIRGFVSISLVILFSPLELMHASRSDMLKCVSASHLFCRILISRLFAAALSLLQLSHC